MIFQDRRTGKRVKQVGGGATKEEFVLVAGIDNVPYYAQLSQLMPCDEEGRPDFDAVYESPQEAKEDALPAPLLPVSETRLNINTATAEEIATRCPQIGYRVAKAIKRNQTAQPGEIYRTLDQIKASSSRLNWDEIFRQNQIFVA